MTSTHRRTDAPTPDTIDTIDVFTRNEQFQDKFLVPYGYMGRSKKRHSGK